MDPGTPRMEETAIPDALPIKHVADRLGKTRDFVKGMLTALEIETQDGTYGYARLIRREDFLRMEEKVRRATDRHGASIAPSRS